MKIAGLNRVLPGGGSIQTRGDLMLYRIDGATYLNNLSLSPFPLWFSCSSFSDKIYVETRNPWCVYKMVDLESRLISLMYSDEDRIVLTPYEYSYIRSNYSQGNYVHEFIRKGERIWTLETSSRLEKKVKVYFEISFYQEKIQLVNFQGSI